MHATAVVTALLVLLPIAVLLAPLAGEAQHAATIPRIGLLFPTSLSDPRTARFLEAFRQGLRELGYAEGQNIAIESRFAEGKWDQLPGLAAELVRIKVDVIVTYTTPATQAAKQVTGTIPIVVAAVIDPVGAGLVASLAHPGGNITGLSQMVPELVGKQLEVLKEIAPKISRVALLGNPANAGNAPQVRHAQDAARVLGVRLQPLEARGPSEIETAFAAMTTERAGAVIVLVDSMLIDHRTRIADLAARRRLPTVSAAIETAEAGGLMAYGPSTRDMFRRAAAYVAKILKGAKPADLPIEQPTKFELVINLRTARALELTIPQSVLLRADQVIQ
ncbi:MAG TPA: ABC transporter substrate-binding protein [Methylomirabilota bacterium]|jgi:putative ABC transport system substrate-binding protein|nr:ABC transporter substrate-binding protein [Methylomirabilota bacterium]